jgi:hypothetical protein
MRYDSTPVALLALGLGVLASWGCGSESDETWQPVGGSGQGATGGGGGTGGIGNTGGSGGIGNAGGSGGVGNAGGGGAGGQGGVMAQGCITGSFTAYRGDLHAHTGYSDGEQTPQDAFAMARDVAGLDIMVVTDHVEQLLIPPPVDKWGECQAQADGFNAAGSFVASCGFEYGSGMSLVPPCMSTGHNNVFFADSLFGATQTDFHDFYASLAGCGPCIGQFNHPGDGDCQTWSNFEYDQPADQKLNLLELSGGGPAWDLFFVALDAGWTVSPMNNQDNHSANWGTANNRRSGLYLTELTRDALRQAMLDRRTFSSLDQNASIRMMADDVCWMGSILTQYPAASLSVSVTAEDPDAADGFSAIELYGPAKAALG